MLLTKCTHDIAVSTTIYPSNNVKPPTLLKSLSTSSSSQSSLYLRKATTRTTTLRTTITKTSIEINKSLARFCCSYYYRLLLVQLFAATAGKKGRLKWKNNFFILISVLNLMLQICCGQLLINVQNQVSFLTEFVQFSLFSLYFIFFFLSVLLFPFLFIFDFR